jgi:hypothetical protein
VTTATLPPTRSGMRIIWGRSGAVGSRE